MSSARERVELLVVVDPAASFDAVVERLGAAGLEVTRVLPAVATVVGRADPGLVGALSALDGVTAVERSGGYELAPPDAEVQ